MGFWRDYDGSMHMLNCVNREVQYIDFLDWSQVHSVQETVSLKHNKSNEALFLMTKCNIYASKALNNIILNHEPSSEMLFSPKSKDERKQKNQIIHIIGEDKFSLLKNCPIRFTW